MSTKRSETATLAAVERQFAEWRRSRRRSSRTPPALRARAVALLSHTSRREVCRVLGINDTMLQRWQGEPSSEFSTPFVEIPAVVEMGSESRPTLTLSCRRADGSVLSMRGPFDERQCRWALKLLAEVEG